MKNGEFEKILEGRIDKIREVLAVKGKEYAPEGKDRLHNFKIAAKINDQKYWQALWGMATKHLVSIKDMIDLPCRPETQLVDEKIGDMINYLILLEALWKDHGE